MNKEKQMYLDKMALTSAIGKVSKKTKEILEKYAQDGDVPLSTIISRAIENEFDSENPFVKNDDISHIDYVDENTDASYKLFSFIEKNPGLSKEQLVFCRRDMGIKSQVEVLVAYRHLLMIEMTVEYSPKTARYAAYRDVYKVCRVKKQESRSPINDIS